MDFVALRQRKYPPTAKPTTRTRIIMLSNSSHLLYEKLYSKGFTALCLLPLNKAIRNLLIIVLVLQLSFLRNKINANRIIIMNMSNRSINL